MCFVGSKPQDQPLQKEGVKGEEVLVVGKEARVVGFGVG